MKTKNIPTGVLLTGVLLAGCGYDNFTEPTSVLQGKVVHNGVPVGVRTNGPFLEIWEDGHALRTAMTVRIAHDGSFSAVLFDGRYKLVHKGDAPWQPQPTDTIVVDVSNRTEIDFPVTPYITLADASFRAVNGSVTASFSLHKIVPTADLEYVKLYLGKNMLLDDVRNGFNVRKNAGDLLVGTPNSITVTLPENLKGLDYVFVRLGVRSSSSGELYYTQVQKLLLR